MARSLAYPVPKPIVGDGDGGDSLWIGIGAPSGKSFSTELPLILMKLQSVMERFQSGGSLKSQMEFLLPV